MRHFLQALRHPLPVGLVFYPPDRDPLRTTRRVWYGEDDLPKSAGLNVAYVMGWRASGNPATKDADVAFVPGLWCESDRVRRVPHGIPMPTLVVDTGGKSLHCCWLFRHGPICVHEWRTWSARLLQTLDEYDPEYQADTTVQRPAACMRMPGTVHPGTGRHCAWGLTGPVYSTPAALGLSNLPTPPVSLVTGGLPLPRRDACAAPPVPAPPAGGRGRLEDDDDATIASMLQAVGYLGPVGSGTYDTSKVYSLWAAAAAVGDARARQVAHIAGWDGLRVDRLLAERQGSGGGVTPGYLVRVARDRGWRR